MRIHIRGHIHIIECAATRTPMKIRPNQWRSRRSTGKKSSREEIGCGRRG